MLTNSLKQYPSLVEKANIIFLDIDGVLNCEAFYQENGFPKDLGNYEEENLCRKRIKWLSGLCKDTNSLVVISSSWRHGYNLDQFQEMFNSLGGEFQVRGLTKYLTFYTLSPLQEYSMPSVPRGCEIKYWLDHCPIKVQRYAILDDDGDMLLEQAPHFFQTDPYSGLTPTICQRVREHFLNP